MDREDELEAFKAQIDLRAFAASLGFELDRKKSSPNSPVMRGPDGSKILIARAADGHYLYHNVHDDTDTGSIIDFVQARTRANPGEVRTTLPAPAARIVADQLTVVPPGEQAAALRMLSFAVEPGQAVGVIGTSGAGKSTLARALTGVWRPAGGKIRLDGAALDQYDPDVLGQHIGYLPQRVQLFDGTIKDNIARMSMTPDDSAVVAAAKKADAHEMILKLPDGYDTRVTSHGGRLSGGQVQRVGLARAMYNDPVVLVLDEPNSNLDNEGSQALNAAIRQMKSEGKSILIMAHRPAAIEECEKLLVLEMGARRAFGPRDEVLKEVLQNAGELRRAAGPGGVT